MLEPLSIAQEESTPGVELNQQTGTFLIEGRSFPEDANVTFAPVRSWFDQYLQAPNDSTTLELKLDYFNSATAHFLAAQLVALEGLLEKGKTVEIHWFYAEEDDVMHERGEELGLVVNIPFKLIPY